MGADSSPKARKRADLARKINNRPSHDRILIVSEGSKTEPNYFNEIRQQHRIGTASVQVQPSDLGTEPLQVVQYARALFENGDPHKRISKRAFEKVFAVFDRDDHHTYFAALQLAASLDNKLQNDERQPVRFRAIASIPSFELWLLLHYEDIRHLMHRDEVLRRLRTHIPDYEKGVRGSYATTSPHIAIAIERASALVNRSNAHIDTEPYTDVAELVILLNQLKG